MGPSSNYAIAAAAMDKGGIATLTKGPDLLGQPPPYSAVDSLLHECPFEGCSEKCLAEDIHVHTYNCPFQFRYGALSGTSDEKHQELVKIHTVSTSDTISSIARRYNCTAVELNQMNKHLKPPVTEYALLAHDYVVVPGVPDAANAAVLETIKRNSKVADFKRTTKCEGGTMEAVSYLYMADFELARAIAQYKGDVQWETQNDVMSKRK